MEEWGWRIAFAAGAVLAVVVFFIRRRLTETASFERVAAMGDRRQDQARRNLFLEHPREALLVIALTAGGTLAFYAYTIYMQKFLANTVGFDRQTASRIMTLALAILHAAPAARRAAHRPVGRKPVMIFFGAGRNGFDLSDIHRAGDGAGCRRPHSHWSWPAW